MRLVTPATTLAVASLLQRPPAFAARHGPVIAGGFEQKYFSKEGARLALLVTGVQDVGAIREACAGSDASGIIYGINGGRFEVIAEGDRDCLEQLTSSIQTAAGSEASMREAWQAPVGGYQSTFPVVELRPKMGAKIKLTGKADGLDYVYRHLQIEAVFNRGLTLRKSRPSPETITLECKGDSNRLKSFVRWCYNGPPLVRPDEVTVEWKEV